MNRADGICARIETLNSQSQYFLPASRAACVKVKLVFIAPAVKPILRFEEA